MGALLWVVPRFLGRRHGDWKFVNDPVDGIVGVEVAGEDHFALFGIALFGVAPPIDGGDAAGTDAEVGIENHFSDDELGRFEAESVCDSHVGNHIDCFLADEFFACGQRNLDCHLAAGDFAGDSGTLFDQILDFG